MYLSLCPPYHLSRISPSYTVGRDGLGYNAAGSNDAACTDGDAFQDYAASAYEDIVLNDYRSRGSSKRILSKLTNHLS